MIKRDFRFSASVVYLSWAATVFFYFYQYIFKIMPEVMAVDMSIDFKLSSKYLAFFGSLYLYSYGVAQIPLGILMDRYGVKKTLVWAISTCIVGGVITSYFGTYYSATLGRIITGCAAGAALIASIKLVIDYLPEERKAIMVGGCFAVGVISPVILTTPLLDMTDFFDWNSTYLYISMFGLIVLASVIVLVHVSPNIRSTKNSWKNVVFSKQIISNALIVTSLYLPIVTLTDHNVLFLFKIRFSITPAETFALFTYVSFGAALGAIILTWLFEKINRIVLGIRLCSIAVIMLFFLMFFTDVCSEQNIKFYFFTLGFFCGAAMLCFVGSSKYYTAENSGLALGIINTLNTIVAAIFQTIFAEVIDYQETPGFYLDQSLYSHDFEKYKNIFYAVVLVSLLGLVVSLLTLNDKKIKKKTDAHF